RGAAPIPRGRVVVATGRVHAQAARRQLGRFGAGAVVVEPEGRNTAAAIALAAVRIAREAPDAVMAVLPADHVIAPVGVFRRDLSLALAVAERTSALVTIGIPPTHPETGYGYIRAGAPLSGTGGRAAAVSALIAEPARPRA